MERQSLPSLIQSRNPLFDECAGVRMSDVIGGLWVICCVDFHG